MVVVAVAGGTSPTLGRSIVQALLKSKRHQVIILSRAKQDGDAATAPQTVYGAPVRYVDYADSNNLTDSLQGVHALVSVLKVLDSNELIQQHQNLLVACSRAGVGRFIMSDWALGRESHTRVELLAPKAALAEICATENQRQTGDTGSDELQGKLDPNNVVECSTIQLGAFMNYLVQNYDKNGRDPGLDGGLFDDLMLEVMDIRNGVLNIPLPADGDQNLGAHISFTDINDVGPLVAAAMDLPSGKLQGMIGCISQTLTLGHVRDILLKKCGRKVAAEFRTRQQFLQLDQETKAAFERKLNSTGEFDVGLFKRRMVMQIYALYSEEKLKAGVIEPTLNQMLAEAGLEVQTTKVEDLLVQAWTS